MARATKDGGHSKAAASGASRWNALSAALGTITALLVLVTAILGLYAARSTQAAEQAEENASDLSSEVEGLQEEVVSLREDNLDLVERNTTLEEENAQLKGNAGASVNSLSAANSGGMTIETVRLEGSSSKRVAPWEYVLEGDYKLTLQVKWTTIASTGQLNSTDCISVATVTDVATDEPVDIFRTEACSSSWVRVALFPGDYRIDVSVEAVTGATGSAQQQVTVLP